MRFPVFCAIRVAKNPTSDSMSARRSRSGGTSIGKDVQPIEEIGAEPSLANGLLEVSIRGRNDADADADRATAADRFELLLLKHSQQLDLCLERQIANLVQKDRAAIGQFESSDAFVERPGERPFDVAEQLAFDQGG